MSSTYRLLCLSHDPALVIEHDLRRPHAEEVTRDSAVLAEHRHCDVVIGRYSSPLIEVACFGRSLPGPTGCKGYHSGVHWIDRDWLKLLLAATTPPNQVDQAILQPLTGGCWTLERLNRLRIELGYGNEG